ncbi:MAG TPA: hypothetical protein VHR72_15385 [Gemmataceae bacterium]|jgi:hypothetical protein|nr:hypothetical protein [Gemmataceae bacterium]
MPARIRLAAVVLRLVVASTAMVWALTSRASVQASDPEVVATKEGKTVVVESRRGPLTYKVVIDPKTGGNITQLRLPADGPVVGRELNDLFFLGTHGEEYTLRGWTGRERFLQSCTVDLVPAKGNEVVVKVDLVTTGTFKILIGDDAKKAELKKQHVSYKDRTLEVSRLYRFFVDRVQIEDRIRWVHPDLDFKTFYLTAAFEPRAIQGPVRLDNGAISKSLFVTSSGGKKVPDGIRYPATAVNFLKNGYKVSLTTTATSFDLAKSDTYFYEKPWQQDWFQLSGFMYRVTDKSVTANHEEVFAWAPEAERPPIVTIQSPAWDDRWLDEKGEVAKHKMGETLKLSASARNSDGSAVPDEDITWEIHIDPWWNTPSAMLRGGTAPYTLPEVANEVDREKSKSRSLLGVFTVRARGKNGVEAVEPFAMLVGRK